MPKPEWGVKRTCTSCRARFYDLGRDPVVCPKCGAELDLSEALRLKRAAPRAAPLTAADEEEELVYGEEEEVLEEAEEEVEEAFEEDEDVALAIEEEDEEAGDIPVPKKGKSEEEAELEDFDEDVLLEDEGEGVDEDLEDLEDLGEDDDLKKL
jgi:uncharacterized protein (TIGR02300 family)